MPFSQNLIYCMNQRGYSAYRLAKVLGVNNQSTVNWMEGKNVPHPKTRQKIADHFGITVAELDGDELPVLPPNGTKKAPESAKKEPAPLDELLPGYARLTEENKLKAQEYIALLLNAQRNP